MALIDQMRFIKELREASGPAEERTSIMLKRRGWDRYLANIPDEDFRGIVMRALNELAGEGPRSKRRQNIDSETKEIMNKIAPDFWSDMIVGRPAEQLIGRLPRESYFVESLGREIPREELLSELTALGYLRRQFRALRQHHEELARVYGKEEAIFAELCRQKGVADDEAA